MSSDKFVNVELFTLSYGSIVRAIVKETSNADEANAKLLKIGTSIGSRVADDIVFRYPGDPSRLKSFRGACDLLVDHAFKTYLGITATIQDPTDTRLVIRIHESSAPVTRFVTIPPEYEGLIYLNPLLGAIKSVLALFHYNVEVTMKSDRLRGDTANEIEIKLNEIMTESLPPGEYLST
jgi:hypothetical protein